jgi:putative flippase GtrA
MQSRLQSNTFALIVPAFRPSGALVDLVEVLGRSEALAIVVVDDGSGPEFKHVFRRVEEAKKVRLLTHAVNLGKGAALKTGINYVLCEFPGLTGAVTADADGQHAPDDILRIGRLLLENPNALILGAREFRAQNVPLRSRAGNRITSLVAWALMGQRLRDTQTGLRGIPAALLPHLLRIALPGYEFELEALITAKHLSTPIREEPIRTIYLEGNRSSHFNPFFDSMRIYFTLLRFGILSILTALLDNAVFLPAFWWTGSVALAQIAGRSVAVLFNYTAARSIVFLSKQGHRVVLPRYLLMVLAAGTLSYSVIRFLTSGLGVPVLYAKVLAESMIFLLNFAIQRDFVFTVRAPIFPVTDWDLYYSRTPVTAQLTRKYTTSVLLDVLHKLMPERPKDRVLVEVGGANSCFLDAIRKRIQPDRYYVIDTNERGLRMLQERLPADETVSLLREDVLDLRTPLQADVAFSVGLIEHFDPADTRRAVLAHFEMLRPGGYAIVSFPTPTLLYRLVRSLAEIAGVWRFPDERPLTRAEVLGVLRERGDVIHERLLWLLILTQRLIVARKHA